MNAKNKLKTSDLMEIDTHIVYRAHRINTEWGRDLFKKQTVVGVSKGSCHSDSTPRVVVGSL